jgi:hypothetical protein
VVSSQFEPERLLGNRRFVLVCDLSERRWKQPVKRDQCVDWQVERISNKVASYLVIENF